VHVHRREAPQVLFKVQPYHCLILVRCPPNFYGGTMWC
jgi:hypothetical protein